MMKIQPTQPTGPFLQLDRNCRSMISWNIAGPLAIYSVSSDTLELCHPIPAPTSSTVYAYN